jgi:hypothetical protein
MFAYLLKNINYYLFCDFIKVFFAGGDEVTGHVYGTRTHHEAVFAFAKKLTWTVRDAWENGKHPGIIFVFTK